VSEGLAERFDHIVLTVADIDASVRFYARALGLAHEVFKGPDGQTRHALKLGRQKINLQDRATVTPTKARQPTFGSGDFCLIAAVALDEVLEHLRAEGIAIEAGPVPRTGALGALRSIYFRDPDGNLVEVAEYATVDAAGP
jgi:catechol 2,3-dioxygenase-like lactoylglutathione lyase family enzyme